jgi:hypothetical protein
MFVRRGLIVFYILMFCLVGQAQTDTWQAWLYDSGVGDLTLIDGQGFIRDQTKLPLIPNMSPAFPYNIAVSPSGTRIAYVMSDGEHNQLIVYDPRPGIRDIVLQYPLPSIGTETLEQNTSVSQIFAPNETRLAFGYSLRAGGWEIVVIDTQTDQATQVLRGGAGAAASLPIDTRSTPVVRAFDGQRIAFTLVESGATLGRIWPGYLWDIQANILIPAPAYSLLDMDVYAPTGEIVHAYTDMSGEEPRIALFESAIGAQSQPLIKIPEPRPFYPHFIENGMAVLYSTIDEQQRPIYHILRRGRTQAETWEEGSSQIIGSLRGTATGFAYTVETTNPDDSNFTTLYHADTVNGLGEGVPVFTTPNESRPRIVWLNDPRMTAAPPWQSAPPPTPTADPSAQDGTWQTWIYQDNGIAMRLDEHGGILDTVGFPADDSLLNTVEGDILPPSRISASPDGDWLVYALAANDSLYVQVYDTVEDRVLMTHRIQGDDGSRPPHTLERAPYNLFNETKTALAFGYGGIGWQIDVMDVESGSVITSLAQESPAMRRLTTQTAFGVVPVIQSFKEGKVHFTIQGGGTLTPPYSSFVWDTVLNTVDPTLLYANPMTDTFAPTGEVIMAMIDTRLPNTADRFMYGQLNTLHVYDPTTGTRTPFYNVLDQGLQKPIFIQNGERILSGGVTAAGTFAGWTVIERDAEVDGILPLPDEIIDMAGTGSGFIYIPRDAAGETLSLYAVNTRQALDAGQLVWSIQRTGRPQIAWVGYPTHPVAYRPWRSLAVPIDVGKVDLVETPQSSTELIPGGIAIVRTTGGDALYLRDSAGLDGNVLTRLNSGTRVTIIRGPATEAGQDWWQIQTPGGVLGWVVDEADGIKTLTPEGD